MGMQRCGAGAAGLPLPEAGATGEAVQGLHGSRLLPGCRSLLLIYTMFSCFCGLVLPQPVESCGLGCVFKASYCEAVRVM